MALRDDLNGVFEGSLDDLAKAMDAPTKKWSQAAEKMTGLIDEAEKKTFGKLDKKDADTLVKAFMKSEELQDIVSYLGDLKKQSDDLRKGKPAKQTPTEKEDSKLLSKAAMALDSINQHATRGHSLRTHDYTAVALLGDIAKTLRTIGQIMASGSKTVVAPEIMESLASGLPDAIEKSLEKLARSPTRRTTVKDLLMGGKFGESAIKPKKKTTPGTGGIPTTGIEIPKAKTGVPTGGGEVIPTTDAGASAIPTESATKSLEKAAEAAADVGDKLSIADIQAASLLTNLNTELLRHQRVLGLRAASIQEISNAFIDQYKIEGKSNKLDTKRLLADKKKFTYSKVALRNLDLLEKSETNILHKELERLKTLQELASIKPDPDNVAAFKAQADRFLQISTDYGYKIEKKIYGPFKASIRAMGDQYADALDKALTMWDKFKISAVGQDLAKIGKLAVKAVTATTAGLHDFNINLASGNKWTMEISAALYESYGAVGDVLDGSNKLQTSFHDVGKEIAMAYEETGQLDDVVRKQLLKNFKRGIRDLTSWNRVTKAGLATATVLGSDAENTADTFADWFQHMRLTAGQMEVMGKSLTNVARLTGVTGNNLIDAVKSAKDLVQAMRDTGVYTDEAAAKIIQLNAEAKKAGVEGPVSELAKGLTSPGFYQKMDDKMKAFLARGAKYGGVVPQLQAGTILSEGRGMDLAEGLQRAINDFTKGRKLEEIPATERAVIANQFFGAFGKDIGEMQRSVDAFKKGMMTARDRIDELEKELKTTVVTEKRRNEIMEEAGKLHKQAAKEEATQRLTNLQRVSEFARTKTKGMSPENQQQAILGEFKRLTGKAATPEAMQAYVKPIIKDAEEGLAGNREAIEKERSTIMKAMDEAQNITSQALKEATLGGLADKLGELTKIETAEKKLNDQLAKLKKDFEDGNITSDKMQEKIAELTRLSQTGDVQMKLKGLDTFTQADTLVKRAQLETQERIEGLVRGIAQKMGATAVGVTKITTDVGKTAWDMMPTAVISSLATIAATKVLGYAPKLLQWGAGKMGFGGGAAATEAAVGTGTAATGTAATTTAATAPKTNAVTSGAGVAAVASMVTSTHEATVGLEQQAINRSQETQKIAKRFQEANEKLKGMTVKQLQEEQKNLDQLAADFAQGEKDEIEHLNRWRVKLSGTFTQIRHLWGGKTGRDLAIEAIQQRSEVMSKGVQERRGLITKALEEQDPHTKIKKAMRAERGKDETDTAFKVRQQFGISGEFASTYQAIEKNWDIYKQIDQALWDGNKEKALGIVKANKDTLNGRAVQAIFSRYETSVPEGMLPPMPALTGKEKENQEKFDKLVGATKDKAAMALASLKIPGLTPAPTPTNLGPEGTQTAATSKQLNDVAVHAKEMSQLNAAQDIKDTSSATKTVADNTTTANKHLEDMKNAMNNLVAFFTKKEAEIAAGKTASNVKNPAPANYARFNTVLQNPQNGNATLASK